METLLRVNVTTDNSNTFKCSVWNSYITKKKAENNSHGSLVVKDTFPNHLSYQIILWLLVSIYDTN